MPNSERFSISPITITTDQSVSTGVKCTPSCSKDCKVSKMEIIYHIAQIEGAQAGNHDSYLFSHDGGGVCSKVIARLDE